MLTALLLMASSGVWSPEASASARIVRVRDGLELESYAALGLELQGADTLVLGEKHDTPAVQEAQARTMEAVVAARAEAPGWLLAWEFLNHRDRESVQGAWAGFLSGTLEPGAFLWALFGGEGRHSSYLPILNAGKAARARLLPVNLSREEKAPVVRDGLAAADPGVVPPGFELGGEGYRRRFYEAMSGGHATPEQLEKYFAAQCLTDDVMAFRMLAEPATFRALVVGSFHTDFSDGVVARLKARAPELRPAVVRFLESSDGLPLTDPEYGALADYAVIVDSR